LSRSIQKTIKILLFVLPFLLILIITNGVVSDGHLVDYDSGADETSVLSYTDYINDGNRFYVTGENPSITFYHYSECNEFTILLNEPTQRDMVIPVRFMDDEEKSFGDTTINLPKDSRMIFVDVPDGASRVSMDIDADNSIYHLMSTVPYHTMKWKAFCFLTLTTLLVVVYGLLYRFGLLDALAKRWTKVIRKKYKYYRKRKGAFVKSVLVRVVLIVGSTLMSVLLVYILSELKVKVDGRLITMNIKTIPFFSILIGYVSFVIVYRRNISKRFPIFAFFTILALGTAYVISEASIAGVCWDEASHFGKVLYVSHCFDAKEHMDEWFMQWAYEWYPWSRADYTNIYKWFNELYKGEYFYTIQNYSVSLKKLVYMPGVVGVWIARGLNLSVMTTLKFARFFNVLFCAVMGYFSTRRLKNGRIVLLLIILIPTNMFIASNVSYDVWVTAWAMLGYACLFSELQKKDEVMSDWTMILIPLCFALTPLNKLVYFVLAFPAFFVGAKKFRTRARRWIYRGLLFAVVTLPFIMVMIGNVLHAGTGDARGGEGVNATGQLEYIKANPFEFLKTLVIYLGTYLNPFAQNRCINNSHIDCLAYAGTVGFGAFIIVFIVACSFISHEEEKGSFPWWYRVGVFLLYAGTGAICAAALYISFTPVGASYVSGCQGRYLIPVFFPTLYILTRVPCKTYIIEKIKDYNYYAIAGGIMFLLNMYGIWIQIVSYY